MIAGAVGVGFFLIFLLALSDRKKKQTSEVPLDFTQTEFEKLCVQVIEGMKLDIEEASRSDSTQVDIIAVNSVPIIGGKLLVHCLYEKPEQVIGTAEILELSNRVISERLSKGIFITTASFTDEIPGISELAPLEFIDGKAFRKLIEKYVPDYFAIRS